MLFVKIEALGDASPVALPLSSYQAAQTDEVSKSLLNLKDEPLKVFSSDDIVGTQEFLYPGATDC